MARKHPRTTAIEILDNTTIYAWYKGPKQIVGKHFWNDRLYTIRPAVETFISQMNRRARVEFTSIHGGLLKFNAFTSDGIVYVCCPNGKRFSRNYTLPSVKRGGGSVMIWGSFFKIMTRPSCAHWMLHNWHFTLVSKITFPWVRRTFAHEFIPQQDSSPKCTSRAAKHFLDGKELAIFA